MLDLLVGWRWACSSKGATAASKPGSSAGWGRR